MQLDANNSPLVIKKLQDIFTNFKIKFSYYNNPDV